MESSKLQIHLQLKLNSGSEKIVSENCSASKTFSTDSLFIHKICKTFMLI